MIRHLTLTSLAALATLLPACTSAARQREYAEAAGRGQECAAQFRQAVRKSSTAKLRLMATGRDAERELPVPAEEYALLREIMLHTAAVPPALETDDSGWREFPWVTELIFADAQGSELTGIIINYERWMPQSRAKKLHPQRRRRWDVPDWSLPDSDLATLHTLPTFLRAQALSRS